jgi:RND superfamily putative drug exporter
VSDAGRVIATAAMIMFCVFGSFAFGGGRRIVTELGVALAVAVVYDAFVVRLTVMPALLHLIGKRAWAFPERLDRVVPRISVEGHEYPTQPPEPTPALVLVPEMSPRVNHH